MKIPINGFIDYDENDPDIEFRKKRWDYWDILKKVHQEYMTDLKDLQTSFDAIEFEKYVLKTYGLKMQIVDDRITDKFEIIDEKLYTYFLLKHG